MHIRTLNNIHFKILIFILMVLVCIPFFFNMNSKHISISGGCDQHLSPYLQYKKFGSAAISYCQNKDADTLKISSDYFKKTDTINIVYSGYPETDGLSVSIQNDNGKRERIYLKNVGERWTPVQLSISDSFKNGENIKLIFEDQSKQPFGWLGIADIKTDYNFWSYNYFKVLITIILLHAICSVFMGASIFRFGQVSGSLLFLIFIGLSGYLSFWSFFINKSMGIVFSCSLVILLLYFATNRMKYAYFKYAFYKLLPTSLYTLFIITIAFYPFNQAGNISQIAETRWLSLPIDNWLPKIFADQVWRGSLSHPMIGDWLSSDRPPLQTGINLIFYIFSHSDLTYQIISTYLQSLFFIPLLCWAISHGKKFTSLIIISIALTSLFSVHTVFVWPKIIAATYTMIFLLASCSILSNLNKSHRLFLIAFSAPLAMLSHGGSIFGLIGISLVSLFMHKKTFILDILKVLPVMILIYAPWSYYQHNIDPPGNRLLKWHLAGVESVNDLSLSDSLKGAYTKLTFSAWIDAKITNANTIFSGTPEFISDLYFTIIDSKNRFSAKDRDTLLGKSFFTFFYSLWWLSPLITIPIFLCRYIILRKKTPIPKDIITIGITALISSFASIVLLFNPSSAVIHQNSFYTWFAFYFFSFALTWMANRAICMLLSIGNIFVFLNLYMFDRLWDGTTSMSYISFSTFILFAFITTTFLTTDKLTSFNAISSPE